MIRKKSFQEAPNHFNCVNRLLAGAIGLFLAALGESGHAASPSKAGLPPEIMSFIASKEIQARALAKKLDVKVSSTEADFAFRQAFALCPYSPEAIFRYVNLLVAIPRIEDALRVAGTAQSLDPNNYQLVNLVSELGRIKRMNAR